MSDTGLVTMNPDEALLDQFRTQLGSRYKQESSARKQAGQIRVLTNALPTDIRQRKLLNAKEMAVAKRFDGLTHESKEVLIRFLREGRQLRRGMPPEKPALSPVLYTPGHRNSLVDRALRFLRMVGKDDLFEITEEDAEAYVRTAKRLSLVESGGLTDREAAIGRYHTMLNGQTSVRTIKSYAGRR